MDEGGHYSDGIGDEVYQLQAVVVQKHPEEVADGDIEPALEVGSEDDLLLSSSVGNNSAVGAFHSNSAFGLNSTWSTRAWICSSVIFDGTQTVSGAGSGASTFLAPRTLVIWI
jgi:hypothetical protein